MPALEGALLCATLAATAATAARTHHPRELARALLAFAAGTAACLWLAPSPGFAAGVISLCAIAALWRNPGPLAAFATGICAALAAAQLTAMGLDWWLALPGSLAVLLAAFGLHHRRAGFAPARMTDEALCGIVLAGLVLAGAPAVQAGWQTALALLREASPPAVTASPATWVWYVALAGFAAGLFRGWLRR